MRSRSRRRWNHCAHGHRDTTARDEEQRRLAEAAGCLMIRLREPGLPSLSTDDVHLSAPLDRWSRTVVRAELVAGVGLAAACRRRAATAYAS